MMTLLNTLRSISLCVLAAIAFAAPSVLASTAVALPNPTTLTQETPTDSVLGFEFSVNFTTTITDIGIFDEGSNGLGSPHSAAIWDDNGTIIAQVLFAFGAGELEDGFRFIDISPVILTPGLKYVIGAFYNNSNSDNIAVAMFNTEYSLDPNVTISGGRSTTGGFGFPDTETREIFFGPNFRFTAVPVPGAVWLFASALLGMVATRRRA